MGLPKRTKTKTEHTGAKNGGGYWGERAEAKRVCSKHRRNNDKFEAEEGLQDYLNNYTREGIEKLRKDIEDQLAWDCYQAENEAARQGKPYNCTCPNVASWTDDQVLEYLGLKNEKER